MRLEEFAENILSYAAKQSNKTKTKSGLKWSAFFDDSGVLIGFLDGFHKVEILLWSQVKFLFEGAEKVGVI